MLRPALVAVAVLAAVAPVVAGCGGRSIRPEAPTGPRLTSERLGDVRGALTYDGDWMGGAPIAEALPGALDLARRRGVGLLVDLRSDAARAMFPLDGPAAEAGMELLLVDRNLPSETIQELTFEISDASIDRVREILGDPGRPHALLLDDDGVLAASLYAIHLTADLGVDVDEALRAARSSGLTEDDESFVRRQLTRIRG